MSLCLICMHVENKIIFVTSKVILYSLRIFFHYILDAAADNPNLSGDGHAEEDWIDVSVGKCGNTKRIKLT